MKITELRSQNNAELARKLDDAYQEMFNLRFQRAPGSWPIRLASGKSSETLRGSRPSCASASWRVSKENQDA